MTRKGASLAIAALWAITICGSPALAAETRLDGTFDSTIEQQVVNPVGAPDGMIIAEVAKGTSSDPGTPLDNAKVFMNETLALTKGNGPQHGVMTLSTDKGSMTSSYWGDVKTTIVEGQPRTTVSGDWKMIAGTGIYSKASAKGTYSASAISKTGIKGGYKGSLTMP